MKTSTALFYEDLKSGVYEDEDIHEAILALGDIRRGLKPSFIDKKKLDAIRKKHRMKDYNPNHDPATGQFSEGGGSGGIKGGGSVNVKTDVSVAPKSTPQHEGVSSIGELYSKAKASEAGFKSTVEGLASDTGGKAVFTPPEFAEPGTILKSRGSAERKLKDELDGDVSKLGDVVRGTVLYNSVTETRAGLKAFIQSHGASIVRIKDRHENPIVSGYRDVLVNYRMPNGLTAEIQFNSKTMMDYKLGEGHKLYEEERKPGLTEERRNAVRMKAKQGYDAAWQRDGNSDYKK